MSEVKRIEDWTAEETFQYMDTLVRLFSPNIYSIISKIMESKEGYKPTDKEIETAVLLDFLGFVPKENLND